MRYSFSSLSGHPKEAEVKPSAALMRVPVRNAEDPIAGLSVKLNALVEAPLCPKGLIMICGQMGGLTRDVQSWADQMNAALMVVADENLPIDWLRAHAGRMDFMLVDADYLGDTESTVDFCMQIRRAVPSLPLIMVSSEVRAHDFTCERMMACDATLKPPLMRTALTMGVQAAYQNNAYFQKARA